jgi:ribosomal protein S18 acetylase RimI-like enzyme
MPDSILIRPAISSDILALTELDHDYSTDHVWQMGYVSGAEEISVIFRQVRLPRAMRVEYPRHPQWLVDEWNKRAGLLVAEIEGTITGYLVIVHHQAAEAGWVTDLVVGAPQRRQGIGERLLGEAHTWCRQRQIDRLFVEMQSKNYPAISLARKMNFVFAGYSDHYYQDQDIALFFCRELR